MAQAPLVMSVELKLALLRNEPIFIILFGYDSHSVEGVSKPLYAVNLRDCATPAVKGRVEFHIPTLSVIGRMVVTDARYAKQDTTPGGFSDLGKVHGCGWPVEVVNGNLNLQGLYVELT